MEQQSSTLSTGDLTAGDPATGATSESATGKNAPRKTAYERLRRRWLGSLAQYPLVVLLGVSLVAIRLTEWLGTVAWFALIASIAACMIPWLQQRQVRSNQDAAPWVTIGWMLTIGLAFSVAHEQSRWQADERVREWQAHSAGDSNNPLVKPTAWEPVAVRATIEESLRYRRSTTPRATPDQTVVGSDDVSADALPQWQTLTRVRVTAAQWQGGWRPSALTASLVIDEKIRGLYPGDSVEIYGHWRLPPEPSNPGQFDLRRRYAELGLTAQLKAESGRQLQELTRGGFLRFDRVLAWATDAALQSIERYVPMGQSALAAALVLGQREQAHWQLQEELLATGTIHMLSISGMHIEMVAVALLITGMIVRLPRSWTLVGTAVICIAYALLCGANPPVARATIMLCAACAARLVGWPYTSLNILALAGLVLLTQRTAIAFEIGTQLSFLAVAVLILTFPILRQRQTPLGRLLESRQSRWASYRMHARRFAWESLRSSFWVCFLSAPLVWSSFHILSPIAVALNLVLWLPLLIALLSGLALVVFGWLPPVAALLGMLCGGSLWMLTQTVALAEKLPMGHVWAAAPPGWWLIAFYTIALTIALWRGTKRISARRLLLRCLGGWFLLGLAYEPTNRWWNRHFGSVAGAKLAVTWIDVGHGTCTVLEMPNGETWLYDAGRLGDHERSYQPIAQCLWHLGRSRLDRMILSHADSDHYNAMPGILARFFPSELVTTQAVIRHNSPSLQSLLAQAEGQGIRIETWSAGDRYLGRGGWRVEAIHPTSAAMDATRASDNSKSLCVVLHYAGRSILLPGDLEPPGVEQLSSQAAIDVDAMMAPHHGSLSAKAERVIAWASPEIVVISCSSRGISQRVLDRFAPDGQQLWITARDHAIRLEIDAAGNLETLRWQDSQWMTVDGASQFKE